MTKKRNSKVLRVGVVKIEKITIKDEITKRDVILHKGFPVKIVELPENSGMGHFQYRQWKFGRALIDFPASLDEVEIVEYKLDDVFIERVRHDIYATWCQMANDIEESMRWQRQKVTNLIAIECCLDADSISTVGNHRDTDLLLGFMYDVFGYDRVFKFLVEKINLR